MPTPTSFEGLKFEQPTIWREVVKAMGELESLVWSDPMVTDELTRAEGIRQLTRIIAGAFPITMEQLDPRYPQFLQLLSTRTQWGLPSADCHYLWAPVHGDYSYRLIGDRGTAKVIDLEVRHSHIARLGEWKQFDRLTDLEVGPQNQVEVVMSRERPADAANWLKLPDGPGNIVFRQYFYDWDREQAARLTIVTEGIKYPPPPLKPADIRRNLELFCDFLKQTPAGFRQTVEAYYKAPDDALSFDGIDYAFASVKYGKGRYHCAQGEAIILETKLPKTPFWNIQIGSHFWEARDFHLRQTSLNGHQAYVDEQGIFRAVISHEDPGIGNWLDAGGHDKGLITIRYYDADSTPLVSLRKVKLGDLAKTLPAATPRVTPEARQKILRARAWSMPRLGRY
jgi:hypothetical protein